MEIITTVKVKQKQRWVRMSEAPKELGMTRLTLAKRLRWFGITPVKRGWDGRERFIDVNELERLLKR